MGIVEAKRDLRARMRAVRSDMGPEGRARVDRAICERVCGLAEWQAAPVVLPYLSFGAEVDTRGLIARAWEAGKVVALPRCVGGTRQMRWYVVESLDGLERSRLGVEEPVADPARVLDPAGAGACALTLVPGLAFDPAGFRIGYGGGFYDAFLGGFPGVRLGLCREAQLVASLRDEGVLEPHDLPCDLVVSELRTYR